MNEDCQKCGTAMHELDDDRLCPACGNHGDEDVTMTNNPTIDGVSRDRIISGDLLERLPRRHRCAE